MERRSASSCPCASGRALAACCGPYLAGEAAPATAEALMRSRYAAYATGAYDYLVDTHDPATRDVDAEGLRAGARRLSWLGLRVESCEGGGELDDEGVVTFSARLFDGRDTRELRERSRFRRLDGRWVYVAGSVPLGPAASAAAGAGARAAAPVGRNAPCPCGSGRKHKRCCGAGR